MPSEDVTDYPPATLAPSLTTSGNCCEMKMKMNMQISYGVSAIPHSSQQVNSSRALHVTRDHALSLHRVTALFKLNVTVSITRHL
jgi:hypothetical protein